jgi:CP family cyanate transporter-like MFS transporter
MGLQCTGYYVTLTWLPTLLQDHGMDPHSAGWMLSYSAFPGIAAALVSPALARRIRPTWVPIVISVLCYAAAYAGLAAAPVHPAYLWMTLLGLGQGASISLSLSYIAWRSRDARHTAQVSTMAQGFGYLLASLGPIAVGAIHAASGSWTVPLVVLAALLVPQLVAGVLASRERQVLAPYENTASQPAKAGEAMSGDEVSQAPWDARDWFTPAGGTRPPRQYPERGWPAAGGEHHAG